MVEKSKSKFPYIYSYTQLEPRTQRLILITGRIISFLTAAVYAANGSGAVGVIFLFVLDFILFQVVYWLFIAALLWIIS